MGIFRRIVVLAALALVCASAQAQGSIRVQPGDWGAASVQDIEVVLRSVADVLLPDFPQHAAARIVVRPSALGPRVLAEKTADGSYQVLLNVHDARWDQFAYQFSHELCHIVSNYEQRDIGAVPGERPHQWFEEAVCEAVSLIALDRLAAQWEHAAPHRGWASYAPAFRQYAQALLSHGHRQLPPGTTFSAWYAEHAAAMARDPYLRADDERVATALHEIFNGGGLTSIGYLNLAHASQESFAGYLAAWSDCCPEAQRVLVQKLIALFTT
ncbi:MAG TPA: hypothetical protein VFJ70_24015 [Burkholderiales bacterium]|nr:hypothetical protein [Burkholderiales bacterium]